MFGYLDKSSLKICMYVPKNWKEIATQVIYEEVTLHAFHINKIKASFEENLANQNDYFNKLHWTKKLKFEHDSEGDLQSDLKKLARDKDLGRYQRMMPDHILQQRCKFEQQGFTTLLSYLPSLQELNLRESKNRDMYVFFA